MHGSLLMLFSGNGLSSAADSRPRLFSVLGQDCLVQNLTCNQRGLVTSSAHCRWRACLEMFHRLIESSGGLRVHVETVYFVAVVSSVRRQEIEKCFSWRLFGFQKFQHALLLLCAYRCAHLAAVNALPRGGQRAKVELKGCSRLLCVLGFWDHSYG